jgi:hypothetical protein
VVAFVCLLLIVVAVEGVALVVAVERLQVAEAELKRRGPRW